MPVALKSLKKIGFVCLLLWALFTTLALGYHFYLKYKHSVSTQMKELEDIRNMKYYCSSSGLYLYANPKEPLENISLWYIKNTQAVNYMMTRNDSEFSIDFQEFINNNSTKQWNWTQKKKGNHHEIIFTNNNISLYDFNGDDIWDLKREIFLEKRQIISSIFMNGSWHICSEFHWPQKIAILKDGKHLQWSVEFSTWIEQRQ